MDKIILSSLEEFKKYVMWCAQEYCYGDRFFWHEDKMYMAQLYGDIAKGVIPKPGSRGNYIKIDPDDVLGENCRLLYSCQDGIEEHYEASVKIYDSWADLYENGVVLSGEKLKDIMKKGELEFEGFRGIEQFEDD